MLHCAPVQSWLHVHRPVVWLHTPFGPHVTHGRYTHTDGVSTPKQLAQGPVGLRVAYTHSCCSAGAKLAESTIRMLAFGLLDDGEMVGSQMYSTTVFTGSEQGPYPAAIQYCATQMDVLGDVMLVTLHSTPFCSAGGGRSPDGWSMPAMEPTTAAAVPALTSEVA